MQRTHGFSGNRLTRALRAGATALAAAGMLALAMQPTHGGAEDWFDAREETLIDAHVKTECESYCLSDRGCFDECFDILYADVLDRFDSLGWMVRRERLDQLAATHRPDLLSPVYKERKRREKAQHECIVAAYEARKARRTACYDAGWAIVDFLQRGDALSACAQAQENSKRTDAERCTALK